MITRRNEIHKKKARSLPTLPPNECEATPILRGPIVHFERSYSSFGRPPKGSYWHPSLSAPLQVMRFGTRQKQGIIIRINLMFNHLTYCNYIIFKFIIITFSFPFRRNGLYLQLISWDERKEDWSWAGAVALGSMGSTNGLSDCDYRKKGPLSPIESPTL